MNLRSQKGINMITLSIAVIILVIITSILVYNAKDETKIKALNNMYNDIEQLNNKVSSYYLEHGDIPKGDEYTDVAFIDSLDDTQKNPNNAGKFYVINLNTLEGVSLNYGKKFDETTANEKDIYIINEVSHTIYYPRGIKVENITYYTEPDTWTEVDLSVIPIYTAEQLNEIAQLAQSTETTKSVTIEQTGNTYVFSLDATYSLQNDIDLSSICYKVDGTATGDISWTPIGTESNPFTGKFYGNDHEINNLYINSSKDYCGLFGFNNGDIIELKIEGNITSTNNIIGGISGKNNGRILHCNSSAEIKAHNVTGGISGANEGTIQNCNNYKKIEGTIENSDTGDVGGITGLNTETGIIEKSFNDGEIIAKSDNIGGITGSNKGIIRLCINGENVSSDRNGIGGIAGYQDYNLNAKIMNCYNLGDISNSRISTGGIIGSFSKGQVINCYSIGKVKITTNGIEGKSVIGSMTNTTDSEANNNYYLSTLSIDDNATAVSESDMKLQSFVDLLNTGQSDTPWVMDTIGENDGYPILKWQTEE